MDAKILTITLSIALLLPNHLNAAVIVDLAQFPKSRIQGFSDADLAKALGLEENASLRIRHQAKIKKYGITATRYDQYYCGKKVTDSDVLITQKTNGEILFLKGQVVHGMATDLSLTSPKMRAKDVLGLMQIRYMASKGGERNYFFMHEQVSEEILIQEGKALQVYHVKFFADRNEGMADPSEVESFIKVSDLTVAKSLTYLRSERALQIQDDHVDGKGPGGNAKIGRYEYGAERSPLPCTKTGDLYFMSSYTNTYDLNHATTGGVIHSFKPDRNTHKPINDAYCPLNDAHYFSEAVEGMHWRWFDDGIFNGGKLTVKCHYSKNYAGSFYTNLTMTFGDGDSNQYPASTSIDVVAHEIYHGFTELNSNLNYQGEAGAINESFSDAAGEAAKYSIKKENNFEFGGDILKGKGAIRYLYDPPKDGKSIAHLRDYKPDMDLHHSSGIYNKFFFLLATSPAWDTHKAFSLLWCAQLFGWTKNETFRSAGKTLMDVAVLTEFNPMDVWRALQAVGISFDPPKEKKHE